MNIGDKVKINPDPEWLECVWFPKENATGTIQKIFKNGNVAVAVHQIKNNSDDGMRTLHFKKYELEVI